MIDNYFSAGGFIVERLADELLANNLTCRVLRAAGWKDVLQRGPQLAPAIFVWHQQDFIGGDNMNRDNFARQIVQQRWNAVLAVRNVATADGASAESNADDFVAVIIPALQGYALSDQHTEMARVQSQFASTYTDGCGFYPFAFSTSIYT